MCCTFLIALGFIYVYKGGNFGKAYFITPSESLEQAYFEVKVVSQQGNPLSGVAISVSGKKMGTTDALGEWKIY